MAITAPKDDAQQHRPELDDLARAQAFLNRINQGAVSYTVNPNHDAVLSGDIQAALHPLFIQEVQRQKQRLPCNPGAPTYEGQKLERLAWIKRQRQDIEGKTTGTAIRRATLKNRFIKIGVAVVGMLVAGRYADAYPQGTFAADLVSLALFISIVTVLYYGAKILGGLIRQHLKRDLDNPLPSNGLLDDVPFYCTRRFQWRKSGIGLPSATYKILPIKPEDITAAALRYIHSLERHSSLDQ
ncbi:hypothetical protein [Marinobacter salarius]|uniref:Uncharacterized protein n=1 Tax=Marinobacter salarius TaxID=1420917 RepID=A0A1W6KFI8_9GAMM|nr:hypothetical protein [Marinobacter salarius]ARM86186.1 hypothetical protein MARSALSMR5_04166 [Marinobacter salarius]